MYESIYSALHCSNLSSDQSDVWVLLIEEPVKDLLPQYPEVHFWILAGNLYLTWNDRSSRLKSIVNVNKYIYLSMPPILPADKRCAHYRFLCCICHKVHVDFASVGIWRISRRWMRKSWLLVWQEQVDHGIENMMTVPGFMLEDYRMISPKEMSSVYFHSMYCPYVLPSLQWHYWAGMWQSTVPVENHAVFRHLGTYQGSCGSLKVLESPWIFFPDFQGLESPWKQTWSLKVLESVSEGPWKSLNLIF